MGCLFSLLLILFSKWMYSKIDYFWCIVLWILTQVLIHITTTKIGYRTVPSSPPKSLLLSICTLSWMLTSSKQWSVSHPYSFVFSEISYTIQWNYIEGVPNLWTADQCWSVACWEHGRAAGGKRQASKWSFICVFAAAFQC